MSSRSRLVAGALTATALVIATVGEGTVEARSKAKPLLTEFEGAPLSSPKGIDIAPDGAVVIAQGAFGPPGPVLNYNRRKHRAQAVTDPFNITDVAISPVDGTGWALAPGSVEEHVSVYQQLANGDINEVLDITDYQASDPDPYDQEDDPTESNPYGLTVTGDGDALVADAAGNDIIRVTPEGDATTVARLDVQTISTDHIPPEAGLPPTIDAEAVPTSVTIGPDGAIYVGELKGFPFRPGTSHVWRIEADADGALCSVNTPDPDCRVIANRLTSIQDIDFNLKNGRLYVYELAAGGALEFEEGFETGVFPPAVLIEIGHAVRGKERRRELASGQLSQPGGIAIAPNGRIFVTDGMFSEGRMLRVTR